MLRRRAFCTNHSQIFAILAFGQTADEVFQLRLIDEVHSERDFLQARDLESLAELDRRDVIARFEQAGLSPGIEPRHSASAGLYVQFVSAKIDQVQIGDLKFASV